MRIDFTSARKFSYPLNVIIFNLCRLWFFRDKCLWIFGAREGDKYDENSKYMFEYVQKFYSNEIHAVWMAKNKQVVEQVRALGFECYINRSWKGKWLQLRAGVAFYSHGLTDFGIVPLIGGAEVVALWHGMGFKKIYNGKYTGIALKIKKFLDHLFSWTYRTISPVTSEYAREWVKKMFTLKANEIYITGQARNDAFKIANREQILKAIGLEPSKKIVIYMPTYRQSQLGYDAMEKIVRDLYDSRVLDETLTAENCIFVCKLHPLTPHISLPKRENFVILDYVSVEDNQQLMGVCDMLVTDFSSCFVDYALTEQPIIFYLPDEEIFLSQSEKMEQEFFDICNLNKAVVPTELAEKIMYPSCVAVKATNNVFEDSSICGTCYSENIYNLIVRKIGLSK